MRRIGRSMDGRSMGVSVGVYRISIASSMRELYRNLFQASVGSSLVVVSWCFLVVRGGCFVVRGSNFMVSR